MVRQKWLDASLYFDGDLACRWYAVQARALVQPDEHGAARLQRSVVVFSIGRSILRFW